MGAKLAWFLGGLVAGCLFVLMVQEKAEKQTPEPYLIEIASQQEVIDSLQEKLSEKTDSIIVRYETDIIEIEVERDEKIDSVVTLDDSAKLLFFSEWLSEMDSLRE